MSLDDSQPPRPVWFLGVGPEEVPIARIVFYRARGIPIAPLLNPVSIDLVNLMIPPLCDPVRRCYGRASHCVRNPDPSIDGDRACVSYNKQENQHRLVVEVDIELHWKLPLDLVLNWNNFTAQTKGGQVRVAVGVKRGLSPAASGAFRAQHQ